VAVRRDLAGHDRIVEGRRGSWGDGDEDASGGQEGSHSLLDHPEWGRGNRPRHNFCAPY
jgi:hypothetical protein